MSVTDEIIFNYGKIALVCHSDTSFMLVSFSKMSDNSQIYQADKDRFAQLHLSPMKGRNLKTQVNHAVHSPLQPKKPFVEGLDVNI